jgi:hypothetical protein
VQLPPFSRHLISLRSKYSSRSFIYCSHELLLKELPKCRLQILINFGEIRFSRDEYKGDCLLGL